MLSSGVVCCDAISFLFVELEGVMNSLLSLILVVTENRNELIKKFCEKVADASSEEDTSLSRLRV